VENYFNKDYVYRAVRLVTDLPTGRKSAIMLFWQPSAPYNLALAPCYFVGLFETRFAAAIFWERFSS